MSRCVGAAQIGNHVGVVRAETPVLVEVVTAPGDGERDDAGPFVGQDIEHRSRVVRGKKVATHRPDHARHLAVLTTLHHGEQAVL